MRRDLIATLTQELDEALRTAQTIAKPSARHADLSVDEAYAIQRGLFERRRNEGLFGAPTRRAGHKIGITSRAIQDWLGVDEPDFGFLTDDMVLDEGAAIATERMCSPRAEGELGFVLSKPLAGPGVSSLDVLAATDFVVPCIEVIDSRVADWDIAYVDTVADNASSAFVVVGPARRSLDGLDLGLVGMALRKNGRVVSTGAGVACLGSPLNAVAWLANTLGARGETLAPGELILSGALGPVCELHAGDRVEVDLAHVGNASLHAV